MTPTTPTTQTTTLNRGWLLKMGAFFVILVGFGLWGLADALVFYPRRGEADAKFKLLAYLEAMRDDGRLLQSAVADPHTEVASLRPRHAELQRTVSASTIPARTAKADLTRLEWLLSLQRMWRLDASRTSGSSPDLADPSATLTQLQTTLRGVQQPEPLGALDMLFQWIFVTIGAVGGLWVVLVLVRASRVKYAWEPAEHRLTLPDGVSLVPADIKEFDKRKWHKFFVTLHPHTARPITLDLLRYKPLEEWVLAMEKIAFPEIEQSPTPAALDPAPGPSSQPVAPTPEVA